MKTLITILTLYSLASCQKGIITPSGTTEGKHWRKEMLQKRYYDTISIIQTGWITVVLYSNDGRALDNFTLKLSDTINNTVDGNDVKKVNNPNENIAIKNRDVLLSYEGRKYPNYKPDSIYIKTWNLKAPHYHFKVTSSNVPQDRIRVEMIDVVMGAAYRIENRTYDVSFISTGLTNRFFIRIYRI